MTPEVRWVILHATDLESTTMTWSGWTLATRIVFETEESARTYASAIYGNRPALFVPGAWEDLRIGEPPPTELPRNAETGELARWAFPGGYEIAYYHKDGSCSCGACARAAELTYGHGGDPMCPIVAWDYERDVDPDDPEQNGWLWCDDCNRRIDPPEEDKSDGPTQTCDPGNDAGE